MDKPRCMRGHEFTADNTYIHPKTGWRRCKICFNELDASFQGQAGCAMTPLDLFPERGTASARSAAAPAVGVAAESREKSTPPESNQASTRAGTRCFPGCRTSTRPASRPVSNGHRGRSRLVTTSSTTRIRPGARCGEYRDRLSAGDGAARAERGAEHLYYGSLAGPYGQLALQQGQNRPTEWPKGWGRCRPAGCNQHRRAPGHGHGRSTSRASIPRRAVQPDASQLSDQINSQLANQGLAGSPTGPPSRRTRWETST